MKGIRNPEKKYFARPVVRSSQSINVVICHLKNKLNNSLISVFHENIHV